MSNAATPAPAIRLGDIAKEVTVGYVGPMAREYQNSGIPFLRSQNIHSHAVDLSDVKYISQEFHTRLAKSALRPGDVVVVRTGKPGTAAVVPGNLPLANCADLVIIRPGERLDSRWLSYYLNSAARPFISAYLVGAVQQHFNVTSAKELRLPQLPLAEQQAIAEVLGALDDKIAANTKLVQTALDLAISLVADSPSHVPLKELVDYHKSSVRPEDVRSNLVDHYSLPAFDDGRMPESTTPRAIKSSKFRVEQPCVLVSKLNPRFPRIWDVPTPGEHALASTEFLVLESRFSRSGVLAAILSQPTFSSELQSKAAGTSGSHQRVRPADLLDTMVIDPRALPSDVVQLVDALYARAHAARSESATLAELRDTLLPPLMSGRLRVKDAEKTVGNVV